MTRWISVILAVGIIGYFSATGLLMSRLALGAISASPENHAAWTIQPGADPLLLGYRGDPEKAFGLSYRTLAVATDGGPAEAWLVEGKSDASFAAIYVHGIAGAREDGYRHLSMLAEAGVPTLLITYRNDAGAPIAPEGIHAFGLIEWPDLEASVAALNELGHDRVIVIAESMGGAILGQFLRHSPLADHVLAIALDAPVIELRGVLVSFAARHPLPFKRQIAQIALFLMSQSTGLDFGATDVTPEIAGFAGPMFVAHGSKDSLVPISQTLNMLKERQGVTILVQTTGEHLTSFHAAPAEYREGFTRFLTLAADQAAATR